MNIITTLNKNIISNAGLEELINNNLLLYINTFEKSVSNQESIRHFKTIFEYFPPKNIIKYPNVSATHDIKYGYKGIKIFSSL